jgi:two-component system, response regulator RegA
MLVVDDDQIFRTRLIKALSTRGYDTHDAASVDQAIEVARRVKPDHAIVDLRMPGQSGLILISELVQIRPDIQVIVLTGYGSIATAVEAMRRGAMDYLQKPCDADQIVAAFDRAGEQESGTPADEPEPVPTLARVEWEHIQRVLADTGGNISEAARRLKLHRRSLQRKLFKMQPTE